MHYWVNQFLATPDSPGGTRHIDFAARLVGRGIPLELVGSDFNLTARTYGRRRSARDLPAVTQQVGDVRVHWLWAAPYRRNDWRRYANMVSFGGAVFSFLARAPVTRDTVFIGSSPNLLAAQATAFAAAARRVRFVLEVRDLWPESLIEVTGREGAVARGLRVIADDLYRRAHKIIVLTERNADAIAARGIARDKFVYIPNSVDPSMFGEGSMMPPTTSTSAVVPPGKFCAIYAGAHGPANDLDSLLDAARLLAARGDDRVHIVLVGDGTEKPRLQKKALEERLSNVTFLDPVPKAQIPWLFSQCHAGILVLRDLPLFRYGVSPNKLFDYMGASLPVVTNVAGDCADIVRQSGCGLTVAPGDPSALAEGLSRLARDPGALTLGAAGRRHVMQHFNRERLVERIVTLLV
ncbi:MAG: glycosyltransferase family 4 protein [Deltaproteobacteria bacterium]|nr:glycosyltransferase family 4 protein [Kofleriaceae bacterium]